MREVLHHLDLNTVAPCWFVEIARLDRFMLSLVGARMTAADEAEVAARMHEMDRALVLELERGTDPLVAHAFVAEHVRWLGGLAELIHHTIDEHASGVRWRGRTLDMPC